MSAPPYPHLPHTEGEWMVRRGPSTLPRTSARGGGEWRGEGSVMNLKKLYNKKLIKKY